MTKEPLTVGMLKKYFENEKIPDDVVINVLNKDGELTANIELWFEDEITRQWVSLEGRKPFWKIREEEKTKQN